MEHFYLEVVAQGEAVTPMVSMECFDVADAREQAGIAARAIEEADITRGSPGTLRLLDANRQLLQEIALSK